MVELTAAIASLLLTASLVLITWRYARSTEEIARETTNAATAASMTAQATVLQGLLAVQPILELSELVLDHLGAGSTVPRRLSVRVTNAGTGIAFRPSFSARINGVELAESKPGELVPQFGVGQALEISFRSDRSAWKRWEADLRSGRKLNGELKIICRDAYGASLELQAEFEAVAGSPPVVEEKRRYEGGEELKAMLSRLLTTLRAGSL